MHRWVGVNPYHPKLDCLRGWTKIPVLQPWTAVLVYLQNAIKHVNVGNVWKHTLQDYSLPTEWWAVKTCNSSWEAKSHNHQRTLSYFESSHNASYQLSWSWFRNTNSCQLVFPTNGNWCRRFQQGIEPWDSQEVFHLLSSITTNVASPALSIHIPSFS